MGVRIFHFSRSYDIPPAHKFEIIFLWSAKKDGKKAELRTEGS